MALYNAVIIIIIIIRHAMQQVPNTNDGRSSYNGNKIKKKQND